MERSKARKIKEFISEEQIHNDLKRLHGRLRGKGIMMPPAR
jgi:hypothetical protein